MSISIRSRRSALAALLVTSVAAACGDSTGPSGPFDPQGAAQAVQEMVAATDGLQDAFGSVQLAAPLFESSASADLLPGGGGWVLPAPGVTRELAAAYDPAALELAAFFPSNYLGVTFVWDEQEGAYVPSGQAGAPSDGIRLVYYAVDPFTQQPVSPLTPLGHVDLRDLSTAASERLGATVVRTSGGAPVTLADYYIDVSYSVTQTQIVVQVESVGYLSNGTDRLDFDMGQDATLTSSNDVVVTQDFRMSLEGTDVSVRYQAELAGNLEESGATLELTATVNRGGDRLVFNLQLGVETLDGSVVHNGSTVALIAGTPESPEFTNGAGEPLTEADLAALEDLFDALASLFELAEGIFGPAM